MIVLLEAKRENRKRTTTIVDESENLIIHISEIKFNLRINCLNKEYF